MGVAVTVAVCVTVPVAMAAVVAGVVRPRLGAVAVAVAAVVAGVVRSRLGAVAVAAVVAGVVRLGLGAVTVAVLGGERRGEEQGQGAGGGGFESHGPEPTPACRRRRRMAGSPHEGPLVKHPWDLTPKEAVALQRELAGRVVRTDRLPKRVRLVAGADIALDGGGRGRGGGGAGAGAGFAGVVVFELPSLEEVERVSVSGPLSFPYVPGLLSFREGPLLLEAFARLSCRPDLLLFDGQGLAHPRRLGLAAHLGLVLDAPSVGVAKSLLCGTHRQPGRRKGSRAALRDGNETVGAALRTRDGVKPVFVSTGHRVGLDTAVRLVLQCCDGYRIPKPTRIADRFVGELERAGL